MNGPILPGEDLATVRSIPTRTVACLSVFVLALPAHAQMQYQYVPNSPEWPTFNTPQQQPTTRCVVVNSTPNSNNQQYPITSYQVCN